MLFKVSHPNSNNPKNEQNDKLKSENESNKDNNVDS